MNIGSLKEFVSRLVGFVKENISLSVLVVAALLLELTTILGYSAAENFMQRTMEGYVSVMMKENSLYIRNQLSKVEVAVNNMVWAVQRDIEHPDSMFLLTRHLVETNSDILGSSTTFIPNYYPEKGYWFEPYSRRADNDSIESMQLGAATHDYTQKEFFTVPIQTGKPHWCEPYLDSDGAQSMVTTYAVPITDETGQPVATIDADLALDWLGKIIDAEKIYSSSERFLISDGGSLLAGNNNATLKLITHNPEFIELMESPTRHHQFSENFYSRMTSQKGETLHVFYQPIGGLTGWVMVNVCHDEAIFGQLRHIRTLLLLMILAGLLLISFIIYRISHHLEHLRKVNAEKERIGSELKVANEIQQSMLPAHHLQQDSVEIDGSLVPAREVGGDLFDYFIRDGKLFFCIGDVSGKGAPAALLMAVAHSLFRSGSAHYDNPSQIMQIINEGICQGNESHMFVTLYIGVLDLATGHLLHCNAGHDKPVILSSVAEPAEALSMLESDPNLPAGTLSDWEYAVEEYQLEPGSTIFLYTDGLTEAMNGEFEMFGMQRIEDVLRDCAQKKMAPKDILDTITLNVHQFVGDAEQSDDLTMLAIRRGPF